jgi:pSer/pThr/pTyr-binding forkhead associated (FHA) protein
MNGSAYRLKPALSGAEIEVKDGMVIGRNPDCDLVLKDGHPSRKHAQLNLKADGLWVEDLGSANGTFVNGQQITQARKLVSGDRLSFDVNEFEVLGPPVAVEASAATVVRRPAEPATVARPKAPPPDAPPRPAAPEAPEAPKAPAATKPAEPAKAPDAVPAAASAPKAPPEPKAPAAGAPRKPSWADPDYKADGGTKLFGKEELEKLKADLNTPAQADVQVPTDAPYLVVRSGTKAGKSFKLERSDGSPKQWEVGKDSSRDIVLPDDSVSGFHAKIVNEGNRWKVIDQMSVNFTYVNGKKGNISYLASGDRITFGTVECTVHLPSGIAAVKGGTKTGLIVGALAFVAAAIIAYVVLQVL